MRTEAEVQGTAEFEKLRADMKVTCWRAQTGERNWLRNQPPSLPAEADEGNRPGRLLTL